MSTLASIRSTPAPRSNAARARANPILPELRLPMKRTASMGSRVPPAVMTTRRPRRSRLRCTCSRSFTSATMLSGSAMRPEP